MKFAKKPAISLQQNGPTMMGIDGTISLETKIDRNERTSTIGAVGSVSILIPDDASGSSISVFRERRTLPR